MARTGALQRKWALVGAEARLNEIENEIAEIYRAFPELRNRSRNAPMVRRAAGGKRIFSPAGKAAISEGMRKYWARRKAAAKAAKVAK